MNPQFFNLNKFEEIEIVLEERINTLKVIYAMLSKYKTLKEANDPELLANEDNAYIDTLFKKISKNLKRDFDHEMIKVDADNIIQHLVKPALDLYIRIKQAIIDKNFISFIKLYKSVISSIDVIEIDKKNLLQSKANKGKLLKQLDIRALLKINKLEVITITTEYFKEEDYMQELRSLIESSFTHFSKTFISIVDFRYEGLDTAIFNIKGMNHILGSFKNIGYMLELLNEHTLKEKKTDKKQIRDSESIQLANEYIANNTGEEYTHIITRLSIYLQKVIEQLEYAINVVVPNMLETANLLENITFTPQQYFEERLTEYFKIFSDMYQKLKNYDLSLAKSYNSILALEQTLDYLSKELKLSSSLPSTPKQEPHNCNKKPKSLHVKPELTVEEKIEKTFEPFTPLCDNSERENKLSNDLDLSNLNSKSRSTLQSLIEGNNQLSYDKLIAAFEKLGAQVIRKRGSHRTLQMPDGSRHGVWEAHGINQGKMPPFAHRLFLLILERLELVDKLKLSFENSKEQIRSLSMP